jgi:F-box protein 18 (helicase)
MDISRTKRKLGYSNYNKSSDYNKSTNYNKVSDVKKTKVDIQLTREQEDIINCEGKKIFVQAYAGSGKTSTLVEYCANRPTEKFLYIAFNKSVQEEATRKFGKNTECKTVDSIGWLLNACNNKSPKGFNAYLVKDLCNTDMRTSYKVFNILEKFCKDALATSINQIDDANIKDKEIVNHVTSIWEDAISGNADWYCHEMNRKLALFNSQKTKAYLNKFSAILIDECQDINAVMLHIVELSDKRKIYIGDTHQAIYSFMNCINAFTCTKPTHSFNITRSFRFGNNIANRANWIIAMKEALVPNTVPTVTNNKDGGVKGTGNNTEIVEELKGKHTVLARTNKTLFQEAYSYVINNIKIHWSTMDEFFKEIENLIKIFPNQQLWCSKKIEADQNNDRYTVMLMTLIETETIPVLRGKMQAIKASSCRERDADIILSTVHKAKGLEWERVRVCSDIAYSINRALENYNEPTNNKDTKNRAILALEEECNIYYVAITRAIRFLMDESFANVSNLMNLESFEVLDNKGSKPKLPEDQEFTQNEVPDNVFNELYDTFEMF